MYLPSGIGFGLGKSTGFAISTGAGWVEEAFSFCGTGDSLLLEATLGVKNELTFPSDNASPDPRLGKGEVNGILEVSMPVDHPPNWSPITDTPLFVCKKNNKIKKIN